MDSENKVPYAKVDRLRKLLTLTLALYAIAGLAVLFIVLWQNRMDPLLAAIVTRNFAAIVGLPFCALASFIVVALFRQSEGPLEFEALTIKLKGAAGEILLWNVSFIVMVIALKALWVP